MKIIPQIWLLQIQHGCIYCLKDLQDINKEICMTLTEYLDM